MDADEFVFSPNGASLGAGIDGADPSSENWETVQRLRAVLGPVEPSTRFREELRLRLARSIRRDRSPVQVAPSGELRREVLVGAALLSVAGALVYLWRTRVSQAAPHTGGLLESRPPAREMPFPAA